MSGINGWLKTDSDSGKFLMLPPELLCNPTFLSLSNAAKVLYIVMNTHFVTDEQRTCLYGALTEYNDILNLGKTEFDIRNESMPNNRTKFNNGCFVIPDRHLKKYGLTPQYACKLKKELIEKGFIRVKYGGKGKYTAWGKNVTIYEFSNDWKTKTT